MSTTKILNFLIAPLGTNINNSKALAMSDVPAPNILKPLPPSAKPLPAPPLPPISADIPPPFWFFSNWVCNCNSAKIAPCIPSPTCPLAVIVIVSLSIEVAVDSVAAAIFVNGSIKSFIVAVAI